MRIFNLKPNIVMINLRKQIIIVKYLYFTIILNLFISCTYDKEVSEPINLESELHLTDLKGYTIDEQKVIFATLSPKEKYIVWKEKFDELSTLDLDVEKQTFIEKVKSKISIKSFTEGSNEYFIKNTLLELEKELFDIFSREEIENYFNNLNTKKDIKTSNPNVKERFGNILKSNRSVFKSLMNLPACNCRWWGSEWCTCRSVPCMQTSGLGTGCGFMWSQQCDKYCELFKV